MRQYTPKEIQDRFDQLPSVLKEAVTSTEVHDKIEALGKKYNFHIDQVGELMDEIGLIILNLHKSSDFVTNISQRLNVSSKLAYQLAEDVNRDIFGSIKNYLQESEPKPSIEPVETKKNPEDQTTSSLEHLGDITIEKQEPEPENGKVTSADRVDILANLENPPAVAVSHTSPPPKNLPTVEENGPFDEPGKAKEDYTEPLVDYLLKNPDGHPTSTATPPPAQPKPKPSSDLDPYREQVK